MKKIKFLLFAAFIIQNNCFFSQAGAKWATGGNGIGNGDFIGTTNNFPLDFRINNSSRMILGTDGNLVISNLSGSGNRVLLSDASGKIISLAAGSPGQFLQSNGTWATLPGSATSWSVSGNDLLSTNSGNIGIGMNTPQYKLDVNGSVRISNNLLVGGGIITTQTVNAGSKINAGDIFYTGNLVASPNTSAGLWNIQTNGNLNVIGTSNFNNDVSMSTKLVVGLGTDALTMKYVPGTQTFPAQFKFSAPAGSGPIGGPPGGGQGAEDSQPDLTCLQGGPIPGFLNSFSQMISATYNPTNQAITGGQVLLGHNGVNAFVETQGSGAVNTNSVNHPGDLFINSRCNRNVMFFSHAAPFATNLTNVVSIDGSFNVRTKIQLGYNGANFLDPSNRLFILNDPGSSGNALKIKHGFAGGYGVKIATYNGGDAFAVTENNQFNGDGNETFKIGGDGKTILTTTNSVAFSIRDGSNGNTDNFHVNTTGQTLIGNPQQNNNSMLTVVQANSGNPAFVLTNNNNTPNNDFFSVKGNGYTEIKVSNPLNMPLVYGSQSPRVMTVRDVTGNKDIFVINANGKTYAREVEISLQTNFPDYVFAKDYKLKSINEVAEFINQNQHLPGFQKGEYYEKNGIIINDLLIKQQEKMEEMMLYIIELEKRLKNLETNKKN